MSLLELARDRDPIRPFGQLEVLLFYGVVATKLQGFLGKRELAAKNWLKNRYLMKRGSQLEPLYADELARAVTREFLELRAEEVDLSMASASITPAQEKVWRYFLPRKLSDFFYATNCEGEGREIDRIFLDVDRPRDMSHENAQEVTRLLVDAIQDDSETKEIIEGKPFVAWTGSSFHVYLFLKEKQPAVFYEEEFRYSEHGLGGTFTEKWIEQVRKWTSVKILGGHEKKPGAITIDPSQTPSGKLARAPLGSLHMADYETVNGVSLPLKLEMLQEKDLTDELRAYTPRDTVRRLEELAKRLPV